MMAQVARLRGEYLRLPWVTMGVVPVPSPADDLLAISDERAAKLARVSIRRLRYWQQIGLVVPSITRQISPRNTVRLYTYRNLIDLLVVAILRTDRGMTLQHIRRVVDHVRGSYQLSEVTFATVGKEIYFQHPDGTWEGDVRPDQIVLEKTIRLDRLRSTIASATRRGKEQVGQVVRRRGVMGSKPVFAGTRIPVETVREFLEHGYSTAQILEEYPTLEAADIDAALAG
jgi:DNA-binding transcriptional MerR regulator